MVGSPPGYVGYGEGGQLTDAVLKQPYSVVLFDEIEKAHPKVFNLLLQLLDDGRLTDSVGRCVNFKNTMILMTSNVGVSGDMDKAVGFAHEQDSSINDKRAKAILSKAKQIFRPEFLGRIDEMIVMKALNQDAAHRIVRHMLNELNSRLASRGVEIRWTDSAVSFLAARGIDAMSGARNLRRVIQAHVENALSDLILSGRVNKKIVIEEEQGELCVRKAEEFVNQE